MLQKRDYQERIVTKTTKAFHDLKDAETNHASVMIESPTGSGKTIMGFQVIEEILKNSETLLGKSPDQVKTNWCAMRRNLLTQARASNEKMLGVSGVSYVSMFCSDPQEADIVVFDESHHSAANCAISIFNKSKPKLILGLSATPYRTDRIKLCFHKIIKDAGYRALISQGWLAKFKQFVVPEWSPEFVANTFTSDAGRWGKSIGFFMTVEECNKAADIVNFNGMRADVVTGSTDIVSQLDKFDAGETDILFNAYKLAEGFDCPELKTVFCRPGSKVPTIQMCGRAFRKTETKPVCNLVQPNTTKFPFTRLATPEAQFVMTGNTSWRSVISNNNVEKAVEKSRRDIVSAEVSPMPEVILKNKKKKSIAQININEWR